MCEDVVDVGLEEGRVDVTGPHPERAKGLVDHAEGPERLAGAVGPEWKEGFENPLWHHVGDEDVANLQPARAG